MSLQEGVVKLIIKENFFEAFTEVSHQELHLKNTF